MSRFSDWLNKPILMNQEISNPLVSDSPRLQFMAQPIGSDYETYKALVGNYIGGGRVTRQQALRVPALKRAADLICGTMATLPLHAIRESTGKEVEHPLLIQPESLRGVVRTVTISETLRDLFFDAYCLWQVLTYTPQGFPQCVERVPIGSWTQDQDGTIRIRGKEVRINSEGRLPIILFVSATDPMLEAAAVTVRMYETLTATSIMYANSPEPQFYFTAAEGMDPSDTAKQTFLTAWRQQRKENAAAFVPDGIEIHEIKRMSPSDIQLVEAKDWSTREISNLTGIDADWLSVSATTSRSYQNLQDARRHFVDHTAALYLSPFEQRLSLNDCTPRGTIVRLNYDGFLRGNQKERFETYKLSAEIGALNGTPPITGPEMRELENRAPLDSAEEES